jgi:hypothetical protein
MFTELCTAEKTYHVNSSLTDVLGISYIFWGGVRKFYSKYTDSTLVFVFTVQQTLYRTGQEVKFPRISRKSVHEGGKVTGRL